MLEPHIGIEAETEYRINRQLNRRPRAVMPGPRRRHALARRFRRLADVRTTSTTGGRGVRTASPPTGASSP